MTDQELRDNIKNNLISLRISRNLTQAEIADLVDVKSPTVASWEQGRSLPNLQTLYRLSAYYGVLLEYFYEHGKDEEKEESAKG